ncbi:hypothetical protein [Anaerobacterium chartisolvens]|uniref:hypothetical protein n=1 Tax=Anaerobacterium chartisolvens TaxID=1297424 RepID=UPI000DF159A4|nr:hypothetical protein [Anaerobacterium chartisolvens]
MKIRIENAKYALLKTNEIIEKTFFLCLRVKSIIDRTKDTITDIIRISGEIAANATKDSRNSRETAIKRYPKITTVNEVIDSFDILGEAGNRLTSVFSILASLIYMIFL